jgi:membrane associated rhomboid family serine protease
MPRYSPGPVISFGPGPVTPAVKALIWTNVALFVLSFFSGDIVVYLGLTPAAVVHRYAIWQPLTYMFVHGGLFHIAFNMLALWMFGVELERRWSTPFFVRFYGVAGVGAAVTTLLLSFLPFEFAERMYYVPTIGASGAIYGLLLAYALYFPDRPIYMYLLFPVPAKYFVLIIGAITLMASVSDSAGGTAHFAHLGGLVFGYLYLKWGRIHPLTEIKYRYVKWRMNRLRRKFDVYSGGRANNDWDRHIH